MTDQLLTWQLAYAAKIATLERLAGLAGTRVEPRVREVAQQHYRECAARERAARKAVLSS